VDAGNDADGTAEAKAHFHSFPLGQRYLRSWRFARTNNRIVGGAADEVTPDAILLPASREPLLTGLLRSGPSLLHSQRQPLPALVAPVPQCRCPQTLVRPEPRGWARHINPMRGRLSLSAAMGAQMKRFWLWMYNIFRPVTP
jgi:hypothetical protein